MVVYLWTTIFSYWVGLTVINMKISWGAHVNYDRSSTCILNMLEVKPFPTKCVGTYSYLYFIDYIFINGSRTCHYPWHYQHLHVYAPNVCPFLTCMSSSMWFFDAQLFTHACMFQMCPQDKTKAPPPLPWLFFWNSWREYNQLIQRPFRPPLSP